MTVIHGAPGGALIEITSSQDLAVNGTRIPWSTFSHCLTHVPPADTVKRLAGQVAAMITGGKFESFNATCLVANQEDVPWGD
jgi:hypothetical protein